MPGSDPKQVIVDWLVQPSVLICESEVLSEGGWSGQSRQGGQDADPTTIRFLKGRAIPGRQVHVVAFVSFMDGRRYNEIWSVEVYQDATGAWDVCAGSGGAGDDDLIRDHPWVILGGGGWPNQFHAGGRVIDNGFGIVSVRLVTGNGLTMEDTVDDGLVLFVTDQRVEPPIHAELYDRSGALVSRHEVFPELRNSLPRA
jgi:hypothetical protein